MLQSIGGDPCPPRSRAVQFRFWSESTRQCYDSDKLPCSHWNASSLSVQKNLALTNQITGFLWLYNGKDDYFLFTFTRTFFSTKDNSQHVWLQQRLCLWLILPCVRTYRALTFFSMCPRVAKIAFIRELLPRDLRETPQEQFRADLVHMQPLLDTLNTELILAASLSLC